MVLGSGGCGVSVAYCVIFRGSRRWTDEAQVAWCINRLPADTVAGQGKFPARMPSPNVWLTLATFAWKLSTPSVAQRYGLKRMRRFGEL